jgi:class 3 adenylate cyclase
MEPVERKLAAILAADMVGYSRLMEADEERVLARQKGHRRELIDPEIAAANGRIVKSTGDGLLVEFGNAVDAVRCAVSIQSAMPRREASIPHDHRILYRVGINLGDILFEEGDVFGDAVNVASRLEGLSSPAASAYPTSYTSWLAIGSG